MRLLFLGDLAGTGFGTVTMDLGLELLARGIDVRFVSLNEIGEDLPEPFASRTALLPSSGWLATESEAEVADQLADLRRRLDGMFTGALFDDGWTPDRALVLGDVGSLKVSPVTRLIPDGFPAYHYVPIEGVGLPPLWGSVWRKLRPIATSEFGADEIAKLTGTRPPVVYHGVDTQAFRPVSAATPLRMLGTKPVVLRSKTDCRRFLGWPQDAFVLFRADRHMPRKAYDSLFRALAPVLAANPRMVLMTHCLPLDQGGDMDDELSKYGPVVGERKCPRHGSHPIFHPASPAGRMLNTGLHCQFGGVPRAVLAAMYNAADLYVSTSAEGFGLTIAESLACGVPAVGLRYSSVPEVIGEAGVTVPVGALIPNIYSHFWAVPDERAFGDTVAKLVADDVARTRMGKLGTLHVQRHFSWKGAAAQMADILEVRTEAVAA